MASKIILFLSPYRDRPESAKRDRPDGDPYACPDGSSVYGKQTNDAPVRYLLRAHPDIREIICVVTSEAKGDPEKAPERSAWVRFQKIVESAKEETGRKIGLNEVDYEENEDFSEKAIPKILEHIQKGDEIYLELTGGFRNANMYLLLLSRVLSYKGIRTAGAVYSNYQAKKVEDVSHLIEMFDLVGGMQELTSFGNVQTLRAYYGNQPDDERIAGLLKAMESLTETITLCRTGQVDDRLKDCGAALNDAEDCEDPLMRTLLPVFREKFGRKRMNTPSLIKWCIRNGMIQQALTLYKERMPSYLIRERDDVFTNIDNLPETKADDSKPGLFWTPENPDEKWLHDNLLRKHKQKNGRDDTVGALQWLKRKELSGETTKFAHFTISCAPGELMVIMMDYLYIRALRNMIHHAAEQSSESQKEIEAYLTGDGNAHYKGLYPADKSGERYKMLKDVTLADVERAMENGLAFLEQLRKKHKKQKRRK